MDGNILWVIVVIGILNVIGGIALFSKMKAPPPKHRYKPRPHAQTSVKNHAPESEPSPEDKTPGE